MAMFVMVKICDVLKEKDFLFTKIDQENVVLKL